MWKYRHSVKDNPKSGYDWSATGQWQTAFCVCQREHWECWRPCAQSRRQSKNALIESWDLMWNWHSLTDCTQNNLLRSPAPLCQTMSRTAAVWNQSVWLATSSCCKRYSLTSYGLGMKVFTVEPPFNSQNDRVYAPVDNKKRYIDPAVCYACQLWCPLTCHKWVWLNWYLSTLGWRWTASITAMSCCLGRCFQQSYVSQNVVYLQNNMLLMAKLVIFVFCDFPR